jgi:hypothetical protein
MTEGIQVFTNTGDITESNRKDINWGLPRETKLVQKLDFTQAVLLYGLGYTSFNHHSFLKGFLTLL